VNDVSVGLAAGWSGLPERRKWLHAVRATAMRDVPTDILEFRIEFSILEMHSRYPHMSVLNFDGVTAA
jgi:hypothetical protein